MIEVETQTTEVEVINNIEVISAGQVEVETVDLSDLDITIAKKEYVITGDDIYIPMLYDDAPQWMKDLVQVVVDVSISSGNQSLINDMNAIIQDFAVSYVPLNQYTQSILDLGDEDTRLNGLIETLNSNFNDGLSTANAQITSLQLTKASKDEVVAQVIQTIAAQLADGASNIGSTIGRIDQAIANETSARATSFQVLTSSLEDTNLDVTANATATSALNTYVGLELGAPNGTGLLADVEILQKQNDGVIETTTGTYDVMISPENPDLAQLVVTAEPYVTWKALDVTGMDARLAHIGDVYVKYADTANGAKEYIASYKFIRTVIDSTSPYATDSDGFTWALIVDQVAQDAYEQALNAFDLADNKRRVFVTTPSGPYDIGDLWTKAVTGGSMLYKSTVTRVSGYNAGDWVVADDAGLNVFVSDVYTPGVTSLQNQIDGKIESWYTASTSDPKSAWTDAQTRAKHDGDMWYQTDTKLSYYYSSSTNSWNLIDDAKAIQALEDAATAQATADGKISSYYLSTLAEAQSMSSGWTATEKTNNVGDLAVVWDDTTIDNNGTWRWNGTSWVTTRDKKLVALASDVTALSTDLNSGTGTWASADSTLENSLLTEITDEGARVESKFAYNSLLNINGIYKKSGFGLTTNYVSGSGTQIDPYVSEFWIDASRFKFTNSNVTGSVAPFTIDASGATPQITFNGKVTFSNVTNTTGTGSNLLYNSAPKIGSETKGWYVWTNSGMAVNLSAGWDVWKPTGGASVVANITGNPSIGSVYDVGQSSRFPVIAGSRYEASAYISAHRSNSYVYLIFYDTSGTAVGESQGNVINYAGSNALVNWGRSSMFTTAPGNAATALLIIRSIVTGTDPYCFAANAFAGVAEANQTTPSNWSEGTSAGATYTSELSNDAGFTTLGAVASQGYVLPAGVANAINTNTTTINGSKITTGSIGAAQISANSVSADRFSSTTGLSSVWTGGGLVSANFNGNVNGNIGTPTAGFRLSSGAAGTNADPNIYGAYIRGSTISTSVLAIDSLKIETSPGVYGPFAFTSASSIQNVYQQDYSLYLDNIYSPVYGDGYQNKRISSYVTPVNLTMNCNIDAGDVTVILEVSYNGGGWSAVDSRVHNGNGNTGFSWNPTFIAPNGGWSYFALRFRFSGQWLRSAAVSYLVINGS